jgi:hypothetical protein
LSEQAMQPFLAASFRRMLFAFSSTLDYELVWEERPDVVISIMNERFCITVPQDLGAPTTPEVARQKTAEGVLRDEIQLWRQNETT